MQHIQIANVTVPSGAFLAPMEAVTDLPFRTVCEELGATITFTEFLSAEALTRGAIKAVGRMWPSLQGRQFVVQIFGREPERLARAAQMGVESGATVIDINMGCPAKKVTAGLCGSALMREPDLAANLVSAVRAAIPQNVPVTVKHRLGWDEQSINAPEFAMRMVDAGAAMITVHGRTRSQGFSGTANLDGIAAVRDKLPANIPVIGNGDVKTLQDYQRMRTQTGCNAAMIGRGAMGNPWLFEEIRAFENGEPQPLPPTISERHRVWRRHAELVGQYANERMHPHELRKTLAWYSRGLQGGADLRQMVFKEKSPARLLDIGETFFARQIEHAENSRPADPVAKSIARNTRRLGDRVEAPEPGSA